MSGHSKWSKIKRKDNIERAIKRGTGEIEGADYEENTYEGYGPGGVALFVETLTDNTNRTVADLRSIFTKAGGNLGNSGSVAFLFDQKRMTCASSRRPSRPSVPCRRRLSITQLSDLSASPD